ncbi:hypothetical protein [Cellulomonas sp. SG140]|uniref:hypothetical protein n=1 Tax=Cellulomonas sp. SG140 TaxID=2976536 RepID=UPI0021E6F52B|nr:hypothetical protein [Cellulomonas sp. SG140]
MKDWTWDETYTRGWARTDDPRVLAVIERDSSPSRPDGDAFAPTLVGYGWRHNDYEIAQEVASDDDVLRAFQRACGYFGILPAHTPETIVTRYMRIFHGTELTFVSSTLDRYANVVIFDTPTWRNAVGVSDDAEDVLAGERITWQAYLDEDVYGVGTAVRATQVLDDSDVDLNDWDVSIESWGHYGDESAEEAALEHAAWAIGQLPELLPIA